MRMLKGVILQKILFLLKYEDSLLYLPSTLLSQSKTTKELIFYLTVDSGIILEKHKRLLLTKFALILNMKNIKLS